MDVEILRLAAAPTTRALVEALAEQLREGDPRALSEQALADGELRAALNLALAGAVSGRPPSGDLAVRLVPSMENTDLAISLLGTVRRGLVDALIESSKSGRHTPERQGTVLFLAADRLDGREPPAELKRRIRLTARHDLPEIARILVGLATAIVDDPDVTEVARDCVEAAETASGRQLERRVRKLLETPLVEVLPEEAAAELFGGFTVRRTAPRTGRNEPCPCGSGKKYKRCCQNRREEAGPTANVGQPWGERARQHRSMTEAQYRNLVPLERTRIPPSELTTPRLLFAVEQFAEHRYFEELMPFLDEAATRRDLPEATTPDSVRALALQAAVGAKELDRAEEILTRIDDPAAIPEEVQVALAFLRGTPDALDRVEALALRALREEEKDTHGRLGGVILHYFPALGIHLARGMIDVETAAGREGDLRQIEEARDILLLPPHDPAWKIFDLVSERDLEAQLETSALEENEELAAEAEDLRRAVAIARARERDARREFERRQREQDELVRSLAAERRKSLATTGDTAEALEGARRRLEEQRILIAQGIEERRKLRGQVTNLGSRLGALAREDEPPDREDDDDGIESGADTAPERMSVRLPVFAREFREGLRSVADHVARAAVATAGALAAADPLAWSNVKSIRALPDTYRCRIGHHRILFRLMGEDELELTRLIHRKDLEVTIKKMG